MLLDSLKRDGFTTAERNTLRKLVAKSPVRQPTALLPHPRRACVLWGGANRVCWVHVRAGSPLLSGNRSCKPPSWPGRSEDPRGHQGGGRGDAQAAHGQERRL